MSWSVYVGDIDTVETVTLCCQLVMVCATTVKNTTPVGYLECVLKVGNSCYFSGSLRADMLTCATDKRMDSTLKIGSQA